MNGCSFKLSHYKETLKRWKEEGYTCTSFRDLQKTVSNNKTLILRHDLDFGRCIHSSILMAEMENEIGATATYFVRLHSDEYNPMEFKSYIALKRILEMGHEVGLHFECYEFAEVTGEKETEVFKKEKKALETLLDSVIVSACEHGDYHRFESTGFKRFFERYNPKDFGIHFDPYDPAYFSKMKYLSDSNQNWREGCFCRHVGKHDKVHIATHPGFWFKHHYVLG